ncbi:MAG: energy-coupling factor ABC transporter ATP-binding protein [Lachnospiraceae bacterium]|nr:energy-coupling factor ABC transporter ATP-binding protein [Lachnospiraceae bacterium]
MICFENVSFKYTKEQESLKNINLTVNDGDVVLVCGPSGCGKSTLVRCVNGLIPHFYHGELTGKVTVGDIDVSQTTLRKLSRHVGTVFQNPRSQFFNVDTTSELAFGCENFGMDPGEIEERINRMVNRHDLSKLMDRSIFKLSGGEKQKIACASIAVEPVDVIILDEPSANLDYKGICELQKMIAAWKEEHKTVLIAEHRIAYLFPYITRALLMNSGEIVKEYTASEIKGLSEEELHSLGLRAEDNQDPARAAVEGIKTLRGSQKMLLSDMKYAYRGEKPVFDIPKMEIPTGEIVGIVGANGAGKSTFLRCLCGMERKCKATLSVGNEVRKNKKRRQSIYMVMQDVNHQLFTDSVLEEVMISQDKEDKEAALAILRTLDLEEFADKHPLALSGGQKQRVAIASAIASERDIILFDEPTSGLDYYHMVQVSEILKQLKDKGRTVIIVTHDVELIKRACTVVIPFGNNEAVTRCDHSRPDGADEKIIYQEV